MIIEVTARHFNVPDYIRDYAEQEVQKFKKFNDRITRCQVLLSHEHNQHTAELNLSFPGQRFHSKVSTENLTKSIDTAMTKMEHRLRKYMGKLQKHC